jgi:hypothetical protein
MDTVVGKMIGTGNVKPIQVTLHPQTALIEVDDVRCDELLPGGIQTGLNTVNYGSIRFQDYGFGWGMPVEVAQ